MSYPNQRIIHINKPKYAANFLQIGIQEWQTAHMHLNYSEFTLYLYLAGNADGYNLELSQKAVEQATGIKKTAYHNAVNKLITLGYLVCKQGNIYNFFTCPVRSSGPAQNEQNIDNEQMRPSEGTSFSVQTNQEVRLGNIEIDKKNNTNRIDDSPPGNERVEEFYEYARDNNEHEIIRYLSSLSNQRKREFLSIAREYERKGKSSFWIKTAIKKKGVADWEKWGFNLMRSQSFSLEVDDSEQRLLRQQAALSDAIEQQMKQKQTIMVAPVHQKRKAKAFLPLEG